MSTEVHPPVPPELSRSWLLVNPVSLGSDPDVYSRRADQIILDLEDAVHDGLKGWAREKVCSWLDLSNFWVRINPATSDHWSPDAEALAGRPGLRGVMLAKAESADQITSTSDRLGGARVIALIESAVGVERSLEIASARGAFRLAFGSGDYRRDTGAGVDDVAMAYPRARLVLSSRIANLPGPIDGPTLADDAAIIGAGCAAATSAGMTGKLCLNADHLTAINESFSPSLAELHWARRFLASGGTGATNDSSYPPQRARARQILRLGEVYGVSTDSPSSTHP